MHGISAGCIFDLSIGSGWFRRPAGQGFSFFAMTACFSSSTPITNVFCSELAIFSAKGNSVARSWKLALARTAIVLGETEHKIASELPKSGEFAGAITINGSEKNCRVRFMGGAGTYPEVY